MPTEPFRNDASISSQIYLHRDRIDSLIRESLRKPVTTVVAGAGYGKTQACYAFLQKYEAATLWVQVSMFDNLPVRLWDNFIYAVSLQNKELASSLGILGFPETMASYQKFIAIFSDAIRREKKCVLVFDDFHIIHEKTVLDFFDRFINARIPNLSFVFISRSESDINTIGLLSKGMLSSITEGDLRFNESEMIQYFQMRDIQFTPKAISDIYKYTDGWIFAIHLVALSHKNGQINERYVLSMVKENIHRLIEKELFYYISKEAQDFLIKLSLLDNMPSELLKKLFPDNEKLMAEIIKINAFIRYDSFTNTYRIHHLFLSFLNEKQAMISREVKQEIHRAAADWYIHRGYRIDALAYYEKVGDYDEVFKIIMTFPSILPKETADFMLGILDNVPSMIKEEKPILNVLYGRLLSNSGKYEESIDKLSKFIDEYEGLPTSEKNNFLVCEAYICLANTEMYKNLFANSEKVFSGFHQKQNEYSKRALERCPDGSKVMKNISLSKGSYANVVGHYRYKETFDNHLTGLKIYSYYAEKLLNGCGRGNYELCLAEYSFFQNDIKLAEKYARQAVNLAQNMGQHQIENLAWYYLLRIAVSSGDYPKAQDVLNRLKTQAEKQNFPESHLMLDIASGWFYSAIGQADKVPLWIKSHAENVADFFASPTLTLEALVRARYDAAESKYYEALAVLDSTEDRNPFLFGHLEIRVLKAVCLYQIDKHEEAIEALRSAYELASPNSFDMPFIECGQHMRTLANAALRNKKCSIPRQWLETIRTKSSTYAKKRAYIINNYRVLNGQKDDIILSITGKELEILTDLCHGLTREEIADNCGISVNTVKSMLETIYTKLRAENANDAVRIALLKRIVQ